jgi:hypothetical protein
MHKITIQDIRILISDLRVIHAAQFNKNFPTTGDNAIPMEFVESKAMECLCDVNVDQFERARNRLLKSGGKFMPSFSDFRDWCIGETWMSADEAWARACRFTADKSVQITQITKVALDEVIQLIYEGHMRTAREQFLIHITPLLPKLSKLDVPKKCMYRQSNWNTRKKPCTSI